MAKPSYRSTWQLPGGAARACEYPMAACTRVVRDTTGLAAFTAGQQLVVDYAPAGGGAAEGFDFVYGGGTLPRFTNLVLPRATPGTMPEFTVSAWVEPRHLGSHTDVGHAGCIWAGLKVLTDPGAPRATVIGVPLYA